jgi:hypothetical protein
MLFGMSLGASEGLFVDWCVGSFDGIFSMSSTRLGALELGAVVGSAGGHPWHPGVGESAGLLVVWWTGESVTTSVGGVEASDGAGVGREYDSRVGSSVASDDGDGDGSPSILSYRVGDSELVGLSYVGTATGGSVGDVLEGARVGLEVSVLMSSSNSMYMSSFAGAVGVSRVGTGTGGSVGDMLAGFVVPWMVSSSSSMYMSSFVGATGASGVGAAAGGTVGDVLDGSRVGFVAWSSVSTSSFVTGALVGAGGAFGVASIGPGVTLVGVVAGGSPIGLAVSSSSVRLGAGVGSLSTRPEGSLLGESAGVFVGFPGTGHVGEPLQGSSVLGESLGEAVKSSSYGVGPAGELVAAWGVGASMYETG